MQIVTKKICPACFPPRVFANRFAGVSTLPQSGSICICMDRSPPADAADGCVGKKLSPHHADAPCWQLFLKASWNHCDFQPVHADSLTGPPGQEAAGLCLEAAWSHSGLLCQSTTLKMNQLVWTLFPATSRFLSSPENSVSSNPH